MKNLPFGMTMEEIDSATREASEQQEEVFAVAFLRSIEARLMRRLADAYNTSI